MGGHSCQAQNEVRILDFVPHIAADQLEVTAVASQLLGTAGVLSVQELLGAATVHEALPSLSVPLLQVTHDHGV